MLMLPGGDGDEGRVNPFLTLPAKFMPFSFFLYFFLIFSFSKCTVMNERERESECVCCVVCRGDSVLSQCRRFEYRRSRSLGQTTHRFI